MPTTSELDILLDAIRFGIAFIGALHFVQVLQVAPSNQNWMNGMKRRFARIQNRWEVSAEIAALALSHFEWLQSSR